MPLEITGMPQDFCPERCCFMSLGSPYKETNMYGSNLNHFLSIDQIPSHTFGTERYPAHYRPELNCIFENVCAMWAQEKGGKDVEG